MQLIFQLLENVRRSGDGYRAICPFCGHTRAFLFSADKGVFKCFKCNQKGGFRKLYKYLNIASNIIEEEVERYKSLISPNSVRLKYLVEDKIIYLPEIQTSLFEETPPGALPFDREFLKDKVLFDMEERRIAFLIRDKLGGLIAISGRATMPNQYPRYKVYKYSNIKNYIPTNRNHLYLFDLFYPDYILGGKDQLIIVEGYKAALWLVEKGFRAVALQGSQITKSQASLINETNAKPIIFLDNELGKQRPNDRGVCDAITIQSKLKAVCPVAVYPANCVDKSPDDLSINEIHWAIENSILLPNLLNQNKWKRKL